MAFFAEAFKLDKGLPCCRNNVVINCAGKDASREAISSPEKKGQVNASPEKRGCLTEQSKCCTSIIHCGPKLTQAEIIAMKEQFKRRMKNLLSVAREASFLKISAVTAIEHYSKIAALNPDRKLDKAGFAQAMALVASQSQVKIGKMQIEKIFNTLDFDKNGVLSCGEWACGAAIFFGGNAIEVDRAVFKQIDADGSGTLDMAELEVYCAPMVAMMVPLQSDKGFFQTGNESVRINNLRMSVRQSLSSMVFKGVDTDHNGRLTPEEFVLWCKRNSLAQIAFKCLEA